MYCRCGSLLDWLWFVAHLSHKLFRLEASDVVIVSYWDEGFMLF